jgi:hypothetical protein
MAEIVEVLERHDELEVSPQVREKLLSISAATIDQAPDLDPHFADWDDLRLGL